MRLPLSATDKWQTRSMNEKTRAILTEHLPYELNMLEAAFTFLHSPDFKDVHRIGFVRNAAIEAFWLHARNLIEFLTHIPGGGEIGTVSCPYARPPLPAALVGRGTRRLLLCARRQRPAA